MGLIAATNFISGACSTGSHRRIKDVSRHGGDGGEGDRSFGNKRFDDVNRLNHVRPENEIDQRLRPTRGNESDPDDMTNRQLMLRKRKTDFFGISHKRRPSCFHLSPESI